MYFRYKTKSGMLLDSTVAAVYDRRGSTKGRLVLDILKCSAHASRGDAEKMLPRTDG